MLSPYYDARGLSVLRAVDVAANLRERFIASPHFGPSCNTGPDTAYGELIENFAEELGSAYSLLRAVVDADNPDAAVGVQLDRLAAITLLRREPATYSRAYLLLEGTVGTVIAAGKRARIPNGTYWALEDDVTIGGGGTAYGWAACTVSGLETANAETISEIVDSVVGWTAVSNPSAVTADDTAGHDVEQDEAFRQHREDSLALAGSSTDQASRARLEALDYITTAVVLSNRSDEPLGSGQPAHSLAVYVYPDPADPDAFALAMYQAFLPVAGIRLWGSVERYIVDAQGKQTLVAYTPAEVLELHAEILVTLDSEGEAYPADGDDLVEAAVLAYVNSLAVGRDVLPDVIKGWILAGWTDTDGVRHAGVTGIRSMVVRIKFGGAPGSGDTVPLEVEPTQIARADAEDVTVTAS